MPIIFHEKEKEFHIYNETISYIMKVMPNGMLANLHYGHRVKDHEDFSYLMEETYRPSNVNSCPVGEGYCLQHIKQEYPAPDIGDFRNTAFMIRQENGSHVSRFEYSTHVIYNGKKQLEGLPATYVEHKKEATSIDITMYDSVTDTNMILTYTIYERLPAITRSVRFEQKGIQTVRLTKALSACVDLHGANFEMIQLSGAWGRERNVKVRKLEQGVQSISSIRGASSAEHNPFLALKRPKSDEFSGEVYGFSLIYSGNFIGEVEVSTHDQTRVLFGINPYCFEWPLERGQSFQSPELAMVYSEEGLNGMSQVFHRLYGKRLVRGPWRDRERPILINNWEATYFDFTEFDLLRIASKAKEVGIELFVLDDGWFGNRTIDDRGLGDWYPNKEKLPNGVAGLSRQVENMGMRFGLWIEPEMVNKNSDLYRAHPDWVISTPERYESPCRNQHILDYSRKEVVDYIFNQLDRVLSVSRISYIKWDMNRYMSECYSRAADSAHQGTIMHRYIMGVYDLYSRLIAKYPDILFESCASGGSRFDPGMLYYAPQTWCSDDTDAVERTRIQYGTSIVYPISTIGAHVSAVPNHQLGRITPLETRAQVAYFGAFGYELDINQLSPEEITQVRDQIAYYKKHRGLMQHGTFYRLRSPFNGDDTAWMSVSEDRKQAIAAYYQSLNKVNENWLRLRFAGLDEELYYEVNWWDQKLTLYGSELMHVGLPIDRKQFTKRGGDFVSLLIEIHAV